MEDFNYFLKRVEKMQKKLWLRQVIVPTINDNQDYVKKLKKYISKIKNVEKVELLPYHTMGIKKYESLNIKYRLSNVEEMNKDRLKELEKILID